MSVRLEKLLISNFRSIGSVPVEIELDDIVILVGGNNFGKSTIGVFQGSCHHLLAY
ncbi:AAA family ATPase [Vibrio splendidus]|uniref:AAA family ATPase n=1 Tax=Vibrio splendidus TaxID=29497 RepID=UPI00246888D5|nr:AAA family ATPase [Vibrio splendidus]MDH5938980.1 AAA family ATPase [Vibrio splendidus]